MLEARHKTGGAADTMAPWPEAPEFKVTTLSYVMSLMPDTILRDLQLARHGYRVHPDRPVLRAVPRRALHRRSTTTPTKNHDEFAKFSKNDADAIERGSAWIGGLADVLGPLLMTTPPTRRLQAAGRPRRAAPAGLAVPRARREDGSATSRA